MRILIVEDDKIAQKIANHVVTGQLKLECDIAETAQQAIDYANNTAYDMILMDIGLDAGNNGFDVTAIIHKSKLNANTPVIAVTAHIEEGYVERGIEVGMHAILTKPLTKAMVLKYLE